MEEEKYKEVFKDLLTSITELEQAIKDFSKSIKNFPTNWDLNKINELIEDERKKQFLCKTLNPCEYNSCEYCGSRLYYYEENPCPSCGYENEFK